jgi:hypothetical protein
MKGAKMENLNAEQVKEWLLVCAEDTPYPAQERALHDALALISSQEQDKEKLGLLIDEIVKEKRELFEENKRLAAENERLIADTVRKMQERIKQYIDVGHYRSPTEICFSELDVANIIRKIAKEMLEGEE